MCAPMIHKMCGLSPNKNSLPNLLSWFLDSWATLNCPWLVGKSTSTTEIKTLPTFESMVVPYSPILVQTIPTILRLDFWKTDNLRPRGRRFTFGSQIQFRNVGIPNSDPQGITRDIVLFLVRGFFLPCYSFSDNFRDGTLKVSFIEIHVWYHSCPPPSP